LPADSAKRAALASPARGARIDPPDEPERFDGRWIVAGQELSGCKAAEVVHVDLRQKQ
jgi:hypothetical protein